MPFDAATQHALNYQGRRMRAALHPPAGGVPDRKEALLIQRRVDDILDRRPRVHSVAPDGEIVWEDQSPFVQGQVESIAVNATGQAEVVLNIPLTGIGSLEMPDDDGEPPAPAGGGVGLLDRP